MDSAGTDALPQGDVVDATVTEGEPKRKRGRPPGRKNKSAEEKEKTKEKTPEVEVEIDIGPLVNQAVLMLASATGDYRYKVLVEEGHVERFFKLLEKTGDYYGVKVNQGVVLILATAGTGAMGFARFKSLPPNQVDVENVKDK